MNAKVKYIIGVALLGILVVFILVKYSGNTPTTNPSNLVDDRGVTGQPIDVALDFYDAWSIALKSTSTNPFTNGLLKSNALSQEMSDRLSGLKDQQAEGIPDPVLCQVSIPDSLRAKLVYQEASSSQLLILSSDKKATDQAVVTLVAHGGLWEIADITCSTGDVPPPQGEFSFDKEGNLLTNIPAPLDPSAWYLVYTESNTPGHTAPLLLDENSKCTTTDGKTAICTTDMFTQAVKAHVQGDMTEAGVQAKKIEFIQ